MLVRYATILRSNNPKCDDEVVEFYPNAMAALNRLGRYEGENIEACIIEIKEDGWGVWKSFDRLPTIKEIRSTFGLTQQALADFFGIPKRTIENWEGGQNICSEYLISMMWLQLYNDKANSDPWECC